MFIFSFVLSFILCFICIHSKARETGNALEQEVEALSARAAVATALSLHDAQRIAKDVGQLTDVCTDVITHTTYTNTTHTHTIIQMTVYTQIYTEWTKPYFLWVLTCYSCK